MLARASNRYSGAVVAPEGPRSGVSAMADAFGAQITMPIDGRSLFFVVGRTGPPDRIIASVGGSIVTHLPDSRRVLALAPLEALGTLTNHPDLAVAGPVSVDEARFSSFARLIGLDDEPAEGPRPP